MRFLRKLADSHQGDSLAVRLRRKRFSWFQELLASHAPPIRILDVGGAEDFWQKMEMLSKRMRMRQRSKNPNTNFEPLA